MDAFYHTYFNDDAKSGKEHLHCRITDRCSHDVNHDKLGGLYNRSLINKVDHSSVITNEFGNESNVAVKKLSESSE